MLRTADLAEAKALMQAYDIALTGS